METFEVTFLGTNGSCAYNNGGRAKYGTNTMCIAVKAGGEVFIFDAGSGIVGLSGLADYSNPHMNLLFSHYHADHIEGMLFCKELFDPQKSFTFYGFKTDDMDIRKVLCDYLSPPTSPAGFDDFMASIEFKTISGGDIIEFPGGAKISALSVSHPGGALGYRVEYDNKVFCCCCDVELGRHTGDKKLAEFLKGADLLVLDSFFNDGEITPGWGHSSWQESATLAKTSGARQLALIHHSSHISDEEIDEIKEKARSVFPNTIAAADRMRVTL